MEGARGPQAPPLLSGNQTLAHSPVGLGSLQRFHPHQGEGPGFGPLHSSVVRPAPFLRALPSPGTWGAKRTSKCRSDICTLSPQHTVSEPGPKPGPEREPGARQGHKPSCLGRRLKETSNQIKGCWGWRGIWGLRWGSLSTRNANEDPQLLWPLGRRAGLDLQSSLQIVCLKLGWEGAEDWRTYLVPW